MTKKEAQRYDTAFCDCYKRKCFVPFAGNGRKICRLYEVGKCKGKSVFDMTKEEKKECFVKKPTYQRPVCPQCGKPIHLMSLRIYLNKPEIQEQKYFCEWCEDWHKATHIVNREGLK